jgi:hypothetical protein
MSLLSVYDYISLELLRHNSYSDLTIISHPKPQDHYFFALPEALTFGYSNN